MASVSQSNLSSIPIVQRTRKQYIEKAFQRRLLLEKCLILPVRGTHFYNWIIELSQWYVISSSMHWENKRKISSCTHIEWLSTHNMWGTAFGIGNDRISVSCFWIGDHLIHLELWSIHLLFSLIVLFLSKFSKLMETANWQQFWWFCLWSVYLSRLLF